MLHTQLLFDNAVIVLLILCASASALFHRTTSIYLFAMAGITGLLTGLVMPTGLLFIVLLCVLAWWSTTQNNMYIKRGLLCLVTLGCIALAAHLIPGFNNQLLIDKAVKSSLSNEFSMYFNVDKPFILAILLFAHPHLCKAMPPINVCFKNPKHDGRLVAVMLMGIFPLAWLFDLIVFDVGLPSWWWVFAMNNLLITCVVEEAFFRGFLQHKLGRYVNVLGAWLLVSILFGLAHFAGGWQYMMVATLAGAVYGAVYLKTGRLTLAILAHFIVNLCHLAIFTYPLVSR